MAYTYEQALNAYNSLLANQANLSVEQRVSQFSDIVKNTSGEVFDANGVASTAERLLYSGQIEGTSIYTKVDGIVSSSGGDVVSLKQSEVGKFMDDIFDDARTAQLLGFTDIRDVGYNELFNGKVDVANGVRLTKGFWDDASFSYVTDAQNGNFRIIAPDPTSYSTFISTEVEALNIRVSAGMATNIQGFNAQGVLSGYNQALRNGMNATEASTMLGATLQELETKNPFTLSNGSHLTDFVIADLPVEVRAQYFNNIGKVLNKAGPYAEVIGILFMANDANAAYADGNTAEAQRIVGEWAAGTAGGAASGFAAAELAGVSLAWLNGFGPAGAAAYTVAVLGSGIYGGMVGEEAVTKIISSIGGTNSGFIGNVHWIQNGNGAVYFERSNSAPSQETTVININGTDWIVKGDSSYDGQLIDKQWLIPNPDGTLTYIRQYQNQAYPATAVFSRNSITGELEIIKSARVNLESDGRLHTTILEGNGVKTQDIFKTFTPTGSIIEVFDSNSQLVNRAVQYVDNNGQRVQVDITVNSSTINNLNNIPLAIRQFNIAQGLAPDGSVLGTLSNNAATNEQAGWFANGTNGYMYFYQKQNADGSSVVVQNNFDNNGFNTRQSTFQTDTQNNTISYIKTYDPAGAYTPAPSLLISNNPGVPNNQAGWATINNTLYGRYIRLDTSGNPVLDGNGSYLYDYERKIGDYTEVIQDGVRYLINNQQKGMQLADDEQVILDDDNNVVIIKKDPLISKAMNDRITAANAVLSLLNAIEGGDPINIGLTAVNSVETLARLNGNQNFSVFGPNVTSGGLTGMYGLVKALENGDPIQAARSVVNIARSFDPTAFGGSGTGLDNVFAGVSLLQALRAGDPIGALSNVLTLMGLPQLGMLVSLLSSMFGVKPIKGNSLDNILNGKSGEDDIIIARAGNDTINSGSGDDYINAGAGNDIIYSGTGDDTIMAKAGNDLIVLQNAGEVYVDASDGNDTVEGSAQSVYLKMGAGDDVVNITAAEGFIDLGSGQNYATVNLGNFIVNATSGLDSVTVAGGNASVYVVNTQSEITTRTGRVYVNSGGNIVAVNTGDGNDSIYGSDAVEYINGGAGNDLIQGFGGADVLNGGAGDDVIRAFSSNIGLSKDDLSKDVLMGGLGADILYGSGGENTYIYNAGDGADIIYPYSGVDNSYVNPVDKLILGQGITTSSVKLIRVNTNGLLPNQDGDLLIQFSTPGDQILIKDWFSIDTNNNRLSEIVFADGTIWKHGELPMLTLHGTAGDDLMFSDISWMRSRNPDGSSSQVFMTRNEVLYGLDGNDTIEGGNGNDTIYGGNGNDVIYGRESSLSKNINDLSADILIGGLGNDKLYGTAGANSYIYDMGDGSDEIFASGGLTGNYGPALDVLLLGSGLSLSNIKLEKTSNDLIFKLTNVNDNLTFKSWFTNSSQQLKEIRYFNNTSTQILNTVGTASVDLMIGTNAIDTMTGGDGDDIYLVNNSTDSIVESITGGNDLVYASVSYVLSQNLEKLALIDIANINGTGNSANNEITGNSGNNILDGGIGLDTLIGGAGNDTYVVDTLTDTLIELANQGDADTVSSSITFSLAGAMYQNIENLKLTGSATINATGNDLNNIITGNAGINFLTGGKGDDTYVVAAINDTIVELAGEGTDTVASSVTFSIASIANVENITLTGGSPINATGNDLNNIITGNAGINFLTGGKGDDTYVVAAINDTIVELAGEGTDTVASSVTFSIASIANVENITLTGGSSINATGNSLNNTLIGTAGANSLTGLEGDDNLRGDAGNDTLDGGEGVDAVYYDTATSGVDINLLSGIAVDGLGGTDTLVNIEYAIGSQYADLLKGNTGANGLNGLGGNDSFVADAGNDTLVGGEGIDIVYYNTSTSGVNVNLLAGTAIDGLGGVDTLTDMESVAGSLYVDTLLGNSFGNGLYGLAGDDSISGGAGNDGLRGDAGNDLLNGGDDIDTVYYNTSTSGVDINMLLGIASDGLGGVDTLINIENSVGSLYADILRGDAGANSLNGLAGNDSLIGEIGNDTLLGGEGNDTLVGGSGVDSMVGGLNDDIYEVTESGDVVIENLNEGTDTVWSYIAQYTLVANVENLVLGGSAINGTGNVLANTLTGNNANNNIFGDSGNDTINAYAGDDGLRGDAGNDTLNGGEGIDIVYYNTATAGVTIDLSILSANDGLGGIDTLSNIENAAGSQHADTITGDANANSLYGLGGSDTINAGAGDDALVGGAGSDLIDGGDGVDTVYYDTSTARVDVNLSTATALDGFGGTDTLTSIENVVGSQFGDLLRGNAVVNALNGLGGNDILQGVSGNDNLNDIQGGNVFDGGSGGDTLYAGDGGDLFIGNIANDTITTGTGRDVILFNKGDGQDIVNASTGADNTISLGGSFAYSDLSLSKATNDLILKVGTTDQITLKDWYLSVNNKNVINLQVIAEAVTGFVQGGANALRNNKVENFNFASLVAQFDAEGAVANWQLTDTRLNAHLLAGSDTAAIGGDLAYQYGRNGNLTGMGLIAAQNVINAANFGQTAQTLNAPSTWSAELVKLA